MLTKSPTILHIEDVPVGSLFYYPALGKGLLCIAAKYDGQNERATVVVPLSGEMPNVNSLQIIRMESLSGRAVIVEDVRAEVDLSTATDFGETVAFVGRGGTYISVRAQHPMMRQCLRLEDGVLCSSAPADAIGFGRWKIVAEDDPQVELWASDRLDEPATEEN